MSQCLWAIDCKHTEVKQVLANFYWLENKKGKHSLNKQVLCDIEWSCDMLVVLAGEWSCWHRTHRWAFDLRFHLNFKTQQCGYSHCSEKWTQKQDTNTTVKENKRGAVLKKRLPKFTQKTEGAKAAKWNPKTKTKYTKHKLNKKLKAHGPGSKNRIGKLKHKLTTD